MKNDRWKAELFYIVAVLIPMLLILGTIGMLMFIHCGYPSESRCR